MTGGRRYDERIAMRPIVTARSMRRAGLCPAALKKTKQNQSVAHCRQRTGSSTPKRGFNWIRTVRSAG